jgi:anaerobic magnesium-protoporphyrin IX monomethyl ester cyclase
MSTTDCLLIGHNEMNFQDYYGILENMAASSGRDHVAFRDLQYNCIEYKGQHLQGQDALTVLHNESRPEAEHKIFYNGDCFWTALAYLGSYLHIRGYSFDYINLFQFEKERLRELLLTKSYRTVVLTGTMYVFEQNIWEVVRFIRSVRKDVKIVAGGPYISKQAEEREPEYLRPLFKYLDADFYCYSREGEQTLLRLIDALRDGSPLADIPNLAYREGRTFMITPKVIEHTPLADNMVNYELFKEDYAKTGWANIRISDGCPYACGFCSFPEHGNERYVTLSLERIEREFDAIKAAGAITHIFFVDATFNVPKRKFKELMRLMIRKAYGFKWHCFFRCDQADEEAIELMRDAGCIGVFLGLESASEVVLRNMDKTAHKGDFRRTMPIFKRLGIRTMVSVQVGFPGETRKTFEETMAFLEEIKPDFTRIQIWFCDVTTPVWHKRNTFDLQGKGYGWRHYTMDAETAVNLVEDAFMRLEGVTWIPDPGYNWVFCYMLEKLGMSIERQKAFLAAFGAAAKERLVLPGRTEVKPAILAYMRQLARFDQPEPAHSPDVLHPFTGAAYKSAEAFWIGQVFQLRPPRPRAVGSRRTFSAMAPRLSLLDFGSLRVDVRDTQEGRVLQAICLLGHGSHSVAFAPDGEVPFPVSAVGITDALEAGTYSTSLKPTMIEHRTFGFFIQQSKQKMAGANRYVPSMQYGLVVTGEEYKLDDVLSRFSLIPDVLNSLDGVFVLSEFQSKYGLGLVYDPNHLDSNQAQNLVSFLVDRLRHENEREVGVHAQ